MIGTIFDIKKFAIHDGPGIRTTVFFKGCPLNCWWCHNPESVKIEPEEVPDSSGGKTEIFGQRVTAEEVMVEIEKDVIFYEEPGGGVTFSGGEPVLQIEFLARLLADCRAAGLHTAVDTSGYLPWKYFERLKDMVDIFLYDIKLMDDSASREYIGVSNELVLDNLRRLAGLECSIWLRVPLIPGITDTADNLSAVAELAGSINSVKRINLLPYNPLGEHKFGKLKLKNKLGHLSTQTDVELNNRLKYFRACDCTVKVGG